MLAAPFSSRPKAHSLNMLSKRLFIRETYVNNQNTKQIYLNKHFDLILKINYVESNTRKPITELDVIGHKVPQKNKYFIRVHTDYF